MNDTSYPRTFPTPGPVNLTVRSRAGRVHIAADDVTETTVTLQPTKPADDGAHEVIERAPRPARRRAARRPLPPHVRSQPGPRTGG